MTRSKRSAIGLLLAGFILALGTPLDLVRRLSPTSVRELGMRSVPDFLLYLLGVVAAAFVTMYAFALALGLLQQELVDHRQRIQPVQAIDGQAELDRDRLHQLFRAHHWIQDQRRREMFVELLEQRPANRCLSGAIRSDDGVGFDVDDVFSLPARHRGFGLFNIKERLDHIGGILETSSQHGEGSRFVLVAPLKREGPDCGRNHDVGQDSAR